MAALLAKDEASSSSRKVQIAIWYCNANTSEGGWLMSRASATARWQLWTPACACPAAARARPKKDSACTVGDMA